MKKKLPFIRIDFLIEKKVIDEENGIVEFLVYPDPRRYDWEEREDGRWLCDKYEHFCYPELMVKELLEKEMKNLPIYFQPAEISDASEYLKSRVSLIRDKIRKKPEEYEFVDKSEDFLNSLKKDKLRFVILSLDIVGSTKIALEMDEEKYAEQIKIVLDELSNIIPKFRGYVLKYTGDGLIAYFPEPSFVTMHDLAIDCALTMRALIYVILNPIFEEEGFRSLDIRIGLDSGESIIKIIGSTEAKQQKDIIGEVVSITAKIQGEAKPREIFMGESFTRNLHVSWRQLCEEVKQTRDWGKRSFDGSRYKIFRINVK